MEKQTTVVDIQLKPVKSSQIAAIGYDETSKTLAVKFTNGKAEYRYANVSPDLFDGLLKSKSAGSFFNGNIRNKFKHTLLTPETK